VLTGGGYTSTNFGKCLHSCEQNERGIGLCHVPLYPEKMEWEFWGSLQGVK